MCVTFYRHLPAVPLQSGIFAQRGLVRAEHPPEEGWFGSSLDAKLQRALREAVEETEPRPVALGGGQIAVARAPAKVPREVPVPPYVACDLGTVIGGVRQRSRRRDGDDANGQSPAHGRPASPLPAQISQESAELAN